MSDTFRQKLATASRTNNSLLCVGLDPDRALMPRVDLTNFVKQIIEATQDLACCYKPNLAFFEALGAEGLDALAKTVGFARDAGIPVIGDSKREDIGNTSRLYASRLFDTLGFDAVTVNPYMGYDSVSPFLDYKDRGVIILCRTSNPGAADFQLQTVVSDGRQMPLFELAARTALKWDQHGNIGLVVGATDASAITSVRRICPAMPLLVPGVGPQAGELEASVRAGVDASGGNVMINSSRQVLYASREADFAQASRRAAQELRDKINAARTPVPRG